MIPLKKELIIFNCHIFLNEIIKYCDKKHQNIYYKKIIDIIYHFINNENSYQIQFLNFTIQNYQIPDNIYKPFHPIERFDNICFYSRNIIIKITHKDDVLKVIAFKNNIFFTSLKIFIM